MGSTILEVEECTVDIIIKFWLSQINGSGDSAVRLRLRKRSQRSVDRHYAGSSDRVLGSHGWNAGYSSATASARYVIATTDVGTDRHPSCGDISIVAATGVNARRCHAHDGVSAAAVASDAMWRCRIFKRWQVDATFRDAFQHVPPVLRLDQLLQQHSLAQAGPHLASQNEPGGGEAHTTASVKSSLAPMAWLGPPLQPATNIVQTEPLPQEPVHQVLTANDVPPAAEPPDVTDSSPATTSSLTLVPSTADSHLMTECF